MSEGGVLRFPELPEEPKGGFKMCSGCRDEYISLTESGLCWDCDEAEARRRGYRRDAVLRQSGVPREIANRPFTEPATWPSPERSDAPLSGWSGDPKLVTLYGPTNTGKSMLAAELMLRASAGWWVLAADVPDVKFYDRGRYLRLIEARDVVVVDELGRGHNRDAWEYLYRLIGGRRSEELPTILTTNLRPAEIVSAHPPLGRRILDGWCVPMTKPWSTP